MRRRELEAALVRATDEAVEHALKLVSKIIDHPEEAKYRRLKQASAIFRERFGSVEAQQLLSALGFEWQDGRVVLAETLVTGLSDTVALFTQRMELGATNFGELLEEKDDEAALLERALAMSTETDHAMKDDEELARALAKSDEGANESMKDDNNDDDDLARALAMSTAEPHDALDIDARAASKTDEDTEKRFLEGRVPELFQEFVGRGFKPSEAAARALHDAQQELARQNSVKAEKAEKKAEVFRRMDTPENVADSDMEAIEILYREEGIVFVDPSFPPTPASIYGTKLDVSTWQCASCGFANPIDPGLNSREGVVRALDDARHNRLSDVRCKRCGLQQPALEVALRPRGWLRPNDIRDDLTMQTSTVPWVIFRGEPRPDDVRQGGLGNCWLVCALSVLADVSPQSLRRCFRHSPGFNPAGAYRVRLNLSGAWHVVTIDDMLPTTALDTAAYLKPARRSLWAPLIEKAAAKLHGSYAALQGGSFAEAFGMVTGYPVRRVSLEKYCADESSAARRVFAGAAKPFGFADQTTATLELFALLFSFKESKFAVGASTFVRGDDTTYDRQLRALGLQTRHAYGVLDARQYRDELLVKLRNPNGVALWSGDFSRSRLDRAAVEDLGLEAEDKGVFWMRCADLAAYFVELTVCRVVPESFLEVRATGWLASRFGAGDAIRVDIYERTAIELVLYQEAHADRGERAAKTALDLGVAVLKLVKRDGEAQAVELVASSRRVTQTVGAACDATLEQDDVPTSYVVVPLCFGHVQSDEPRRFSCAAHASRHTLTLERIPLDPVFAARAMIALATTYGQRQTILEDRQSNKQAFSVCTLQDEAGLCVVAENLAPFPLVASLDADGGTGYVSTRSSLATQDIVPPNSRMILCILSRLAGATEIKLQGLSYSAAPLPANYVHHPDTDHVPSLGHLGPFLEHVHRPIPITNGPGAATTSASTDHSDNGAGPAQPQVDAATLADALRRAMQGGA